MNKYRDLEETKLELRSEMYLRHFSITFVYYGVASLHSQCPTVSLMYAMLISITIWIVSLRFAEPLLDIYLSTLINCFFDVIAFGDASVSHKFLCYARIRSRGRNENVSRDEGLKCLLGSVEKRGDVGLTYRHHHLSRAPHHTYTTSIDLHRRR